MARLVLNPLFIALGVASAVNAYFLVGTGELARSTSGPAQLTQYSENFITTERIDSIVNPGAISGHVHSGRALLSSPKRYLISIQSLAAVISGSLPPLPLSERVNVPQCPLLRTSRTTGSLYVTPLLTYATILISFQHLYFQYAIHVIRAVSLSYRRVGGRTGRSPLSTEVPSCTLHPFCLSITCD